MPQERTNEKDEDCEKDFIQSEDTVFLIETTNEYFQNDGDWQPNRAYRILTAFNQMASYRQKIDPSDRYCLIFFNRKSVWIPVNDLVSDPLDLLSYFSELNLDTSEEKPKIVNALSSAFQIHLKTFRRVGDKTYRIVIITQTGIVDDATKMDDISNKILSSLGIIVDVVKVGRELIQPSYQNVALKNNGVLKIIGNPKELDAALMEIAKKKKVLLKNYISDYKYTEAQINGTEPLINKVIEKMASDLESIPEGVSESERRCNICFKPHLEHLKACPNCKKPMHLDCAGSWSSEMKINNPYTFRCPFCFFLLRIPHNFIDETKVKAIIEKKKSEIHKIQELRNKKTKKTDDLRKSLIEFQDNLELRSNPDDIFEDWLDDAIPTLDPREKMKIIKEFSMLKTNEERFEFVSYIRFSRNIGPEVSFPKFE